MDGALAQVSIQDFKQVIMTNETKYFMYINKKIMKIRNAQIKQGSRLAALAILLLVTLRVQNPAHTSNWH
jgi:hypothetical protein